MTHVERGRSLDASAHGVVHTPLWCALGERFDLAGISRPTLTVGSSSFTLDQDNEIGSALFAANRDQKNTCMGQLRTIIRSLGNTVFVTASGELVSSDDMGDMATLSDMEDVVRSLLYTRRTLREFDGFVRVPFPNGSGRDICIASFALETGSRTVNLLLRDAVSSGGVVSLGGLNGFFPLILLQHDDVAPADSFYDCWADATTSPLLSSGAQSSSFSTTISGVVRTILSGGPRTSAGYSVVGGVLSINGVQLPNMSPVALDITRFLHSGTNTLEVSGEEWVCSDLYLTELLQSVGRFSGRSANQTGGNCRTWVRKTAWVKWAVDVVEHNTFTCLSSPPPQTVYQDGLKSVGQWLGVDVLDSDPDPSYTEINLQAHFPARYDVGKYYGAQEFGPYSGWRFIYSHSDNPASANDDLIINGTAINVDGHDDNVFGGATTLLLVLPPGFTFTVDILNNTAYGGEAGGGGALRLYNRLL